MSGYNPLFDSMFTGTLCGKWPDIGVWSCLVGLKDKHGLIDCTPQYLAGVLGLDVETLLACIQRFMQPDEYSRTRDCDGRRLELIDPERPWGWRVINHTKYQEKARKQVHDQRRQESGENTQRMAERRGDPTRPAMTRDDPLSSQRNATQTQQQEDTSAAARPGEREFAEFRARYPERSGNQPWSRARKAINARIDEGHVWDEFLAGAERYAEWCKSTGKLNTEHVMQAATFCGPDKPFTKPWTLPAKKADARLAGNLDAAAEFMRRTENTQ